MICIENKDKIGFENEYLKVLRISDDSVQEQKNKANKNKTLFYDCECKKCGRVFPVAKRNINKTKSCGCSRIKSIDSIMADIGNKYNNLTIVGVDTERTLESIKNKKYNSYCFAECDCGSGVKSYNYQAIKTGHTISCGCSKFNNPLSIDDLTGKTFGRLTVVKRDIERDTKSGGVHWLCQCSCGNTELVSVIANQLRSGRTLSCGCYKSEQIQKRNTEYSTKHNIPEEDANGLVIRDDGSIRVFDENKKYSFLIDYQDYDYIKDWYWRKAIVGDNPNKWYWITNEKKEVINNGGKKGLRLHRLIAERKYGDDFDPSLLPDHLSRDPDDNRRCNIVQKTSMENSHNRKLSKTNSSGKTGVSYDKKKGVWFSHIMVNYSRINLGFFDKYEDAVNARLEAKKKYGFTCDDIKPSYDKKLY